ncbi:hypothetical protein [Nocardioides stalactiti]|uniref:hypothetical protein n=1 Tax=Nocardioides stalactiti TaxID=2755356 RepID=UPI001600357E|nr:hypothetical protein [Nocardioides stalactiti]
MAKFDDPRLSALNAEAGFQDAGMRHALTSALENGEVARASYNVGAHVWVAAVLTDRALILVKGAVRAKVMRVPLPLEIVRGPAGPKKGARVRTPLGVKTLWGSNLDADMAALLAGQAGAIAEPVVRPVSVLNKVPGDAPQLVETLGEHDAVAPTIEERKVPVRLTRRERSEARRRAGKKPRRPRLQKAWGAWVGFAPPSTIWDISYNCVMCGRALSNPNSQRHRVGTDCIKRWGSQARKIRNPALTAWEDRKARAGIERIGRQVEFDAAYARQRAEHEAALTAWREVRAGRV